MGYDLANAQLVGLDYEAYVAKGGQTPDVVLVRKSYEERRRKRREQRGGAAARAWKLKTLAMEVEEPSGTGRGRNAEDAQVGGWVRTRQMATRRERGRGGGGSTPVGRRAGTASGRHIWCGS